MCVDPMTRRCCCERIDCRRSVAAYLVPSVVAWTALTIGVSAILTWQYSVFVGPYYWPFVSDLGNSTPAVYAFGPGLSSAALVLLWLSIVRFWQLNWYFRTEYPSCLGYGISITLLVAAGFSAPGLIALSWTSDKTYTSYHDTFTAICFIGTGVYQLMYTSMFLWIFSYKPTTPIDEHTLDATSGLMILPTIRMFVWHVVFVVILLICGVPTASYKLGFDAGISSVWEWVLIGASVVWYLPWFYDLGPASYERLSLYAFASERTDKGYHTVSPSPDSA